MMNNSDPKTNVNSPKTGVEEGSPGISSTNYATWTQLALKVTLILWL